MSARFVLSTPAAQDLEEILTYVLEQSGAERTRRVAERLQKALRKLAEFPGLGHKREDLTSAPFLFWSVRSYLIVYQADTKPLQIVRVLHGARDVEAIFDQAE